MIDLAHLELDGGLVAHLLLAERLELLPGQHDLAHVQLVLDAQHLHEVLLAQLHEEGPVHRALGESGAVLRQAERVQPARHVRHGPRPHVVRDGVVCRAIVFFF